MLIVTSGFWATELHLHLCVYDPVEVFFTLFRTTWTTLNGSKKPWSPIDAFICPFGCFFSLPVLYPELLVSCHLMIFLPHSNCDFLPQILRLSFLLFFKWPYRGICLACAFCIEEQRLRTGH